MKKQSKEVSAGLIDEAMTIAEKAWRRTELKTQKDTNVGIVERIIRVAGGGVLAVVSLLLLLGGGSVWAAVLEIAGIALGLDFVYTGITGYCPLYSKLGWSTARRSIPKGTA